MNLFTEIFILVFMFFLCLLLFSAMHLFTKCSVIAVVCLFNISALLVISTSCGMTMTALVQHKQVVCCCREAVRCFVLASTV